MAIVNQYLLVEHRNSGLLLLVNWLLVCHRFQHLLVYFPFLAHWFAVAVLRNERVAAHWDSWLQLSLRPGVVLWQNTLFRLYYTRLIWSFFVLLMPHLVQELGFNVDWSAVIQRGLEVVVDVLVWDYYCLLLVILFWNLNLVACLSWSQLPVFQMRRLLVWLRLLSLVWHWLVVHYHLRDWVVSAQLFVVRKSLAYNVQHLVLPVHLDVAHAIGANLNVERVWLLQILSRLVVKCPHI